MTTELAHITQLERQLVRAKDLAEVKGIVDQSEAIVHAAKRWGVSRGTLLNACLLHIDAWVKAGELLGPPPGKGPGRGKKDRGATIFSKDQILVARRAAWKVEAEQREGYYGWVKKTDDQTPSVEDLLILSRCPEPTQRKAIRQLQRGKASNLREAIRNVKVADIIEGRTAVPKGKYRCLIVDPPWPMDKVEREERPAQGKALDYRTMSLAEIKGIKLPVHKACHLYLWTTHRFLRDAFDIIAGWKFEYLVTMVWHKSGGFQPVGLPQRNCEFVLLARRGSLGFVDTKDFSCCFGGKRREHSRKPVEFYDIVRRVSPEPRCDLFSREKVSGFDQGGKQTSHFAAPKAKAV